jgi:uncharacterized protein YbaP (TraB family)
MNRLHHFLGIVFHYFLATSAFAQATPAAEPPAEPVVLQEVVVSGVQPGPGLWKVENAAGHTLWVLGTVSPLPKRMQWNSLTVERRIAESGVVILPTMASIKAGGVMFGGVFLIPAAMRARNNPDGATLAEVLPAADYARWQRLKAQYLGRDRAVEKRRPLLAATELRDAALDEHGLVGGNVIGRVVERAAKRHDVPLNRPQVELVVEDAKEALREFADSTLPDLECFRRTLDQVENDLDTLVGRANAWALGDLDGLAALPYTDQARTCQDALLQTGLARRAGFADLPAKMDAAWFAQVEAALAEHPTSFAVLPMGFVTGPRAYLDVLAGKGYRVTAPAPTLNGDAAPASD